MARHIIRSAMPSAVFLDGVCQWNGKMSEDLIANISDDDVLHAPEAGRRASGKLTR